MAHLIHLNGPPGIGKSTIADRYADRHPGTLNLDIDRLHELVGGWRDPGQDTHQILRPVALAMASTHLSADRDVVVPQTLTRPAEIEALEGIAGEQGATFHEVVLLDDRDEAIARFDQRVEDSVWNRHNRDVVDRLGGADWLAALYDRLAAVVRERPAAVVVRSRPGAVEETYAAFVQALGPDGRPE